MIKIEKIVPGVEAGHRQLAQAGFNSLLARQDLGFTRLAERSHLWRESQERANVLRNQGIRRVVLLGLGGSSLGPKTLWDSVGRWMGQLDEFHCLDNLDEVAFGRFLQQLSRPQSVHFVIISKSGSTLETLAMADFIDQHLASHGSRLAKQATVISELRSNPLSDWARSQQVSLLEVPEDVGGRFSVLTPVGLLPAALMGLSLEEMRQGLSEILTDRELILTLIAAGLGSVERQDQVLYFWPYTQGLETFGFWFQQLWAESLGKKVTRDGRAAPGVPVPVPSLGPRDQHSTMQQLMEGPQPRWVWLWRDREPVVKGPTLERSGFAQSALRIGKTMGELVEAQATATEAALIQTNIPVVSLSVPGLWPKTIGALFFLSELVVGGLGEALGINAFDQPGVELGKKLTKDLLSKGS